MAKMGRPTDYTPELCNEICKRIMDGRALSSVCRDEDMPARVTVYAWLLNNKDFQNNYARACSIRRDNRFEDMEEKMKEYAYDPQLARIAIDIVKFQLSKEEPKKYGDKLDIMSDGKALPTPILAGLTTLPVVPESEKDEQKHGFLENDTLPVVLDQDV